MSIRRFNLASDVEAEKKSNRDYMQAHRDEWSSLGFRSITYMVHDSERDLLLAELDVRRCDKLIAIATSRSSDKEVIERLARRNMPKSPDKGTVEKLLELASESTAERQITEMIDVAKTMLKKQAGLVALFGKEPDREKRLRIAARGVSYTSAAAARFKLVRAMLDYAPPKPSTVFGIEGSVATVAADEWEE